MYSSIYEFIIIFANIFGNIEKCSLATELGDLLKDSGIKRGVLKVISVSRRDVLFDEFKEFFDLLVLSQR